MSHHLDSPLARQDPRLNITDQYVFDDHDATVLVMNVRTSLAGDALPLGFHDEARYEFKIHLDDVPVEELALRLAFRAEADGEQDFQVYRLEGRDAADDAAPGIEVAHGRTREIVQGTGGLTIWAGRVLDPFYLDLDQLGAVDNLVQHGQDAAVTGFLPGVTPNTFAGSTVNSIVVRVPHQDAVLHPGRSIRMWSTTKLATDAGGWRQIGRAGLPMIWPVFRDSNSDAASQANQTHPADDEANYGKVFHEVIAATISRLGTSARPDACAAEVTRRLLPDTLPYEVGAPAVFGFSGFNGRALGDNAPEVVFSLVTNSAVSTGLPPSATAGTRSESFPFVVPA